MRADWDARLRAAAEALGLRYVVGRAGDFFGPGTGAHSLLSEAAIDGLERGRPVLLVGDATASHAFSYVPDVVEGLAALGTAADDVEGQVFHLPIVQAPPTRLVAALASARGVRPRTLTLPAWMVRVLGLVVPLLGELRETLYQWDRPFRVSDARFRARFPGVGSFVLP